MASGIHFSGRVLNFMLLLSWSSKRSGQTQIRDLLRNLRALGDLGLDLVYHSWLRECAKVAQLVTFARNNLAHDATHDLSRARLGKVGDNVDLLWRREWTNHFADLEHELFGQSSPIVRVVFEFTRGECVLNRKGRSVENDIRFEGGECVNCLTRQIIGTANNCGLGDTRMQDQRRLDFCSRQAMSRDIYDVCTT
jgi:hypothetical protein